MKKEIDQQTHEKIMRLMKGIEQRTHFAVTYNDDDKIEELENKLFNLCVGYEDAPMYLKGYPRLINRLNERSSKKFKDSRSKKKQSVFPYPRAKWEDYIIWGLNDKKVKIRNQLNKKEDVFSYIDLNMVDLRTRLPNAIWYFQKLLISNDGCLPFDEIENRVNTKATASKYNIHLQDLFNIKGSVYRGHAKTEKGYYLRIQTRMAYKSTT